MNSKCIIYIYIYIYKTLDFAIFPNALNTGLIGRRQLIDDYMIPLYKTYTNIFFHVVILNLTKHGCLKHFMIIS